MKTTNRLISILMLAVLLFSIAACTPPKDDTLLPPKNVSVSDEGVITWDAVEGAIGYVVYINGNQVATPKETSYTVSVVNDFTYSIASIGQGYEISEPSETQTFKGKGVDVKPVPPDVSGVSVSISGMKDIHSGGTLQLTATVTDAEDKSVTWEVVEGANVISIDQTGLITAKEVTSDTNVSVKATSVANPEKSHVVSLSVIVKPVLTQAMLDALQGDKISFSGYVNIDVYTMSFFSEFVESRTMYVGTKADGTSWYAEYLNSAGTTSSLYCTSHNGVASIVDIDYMNQEVFEPILNDDGTVLSWEDSGYYNCFNGLKVSDFTLNEETWEWEYSGTDATLPFRMISSANPYNFKENGFSLEIFDGVIAGFKAVSLRDDSVVARYECVQTLYTTITVYDDDDEDFSLPAVSKYPFDNDVHPDLATAIANMRALTNYTMDITIASGTIYTSGYTEENYVETITDDVCCFVPYNISYQTVGNTRQEIHTPRVNDAFGFVKRSDTLYNSFFVEGDQVLANRAYVADFAQAKPSFNVAPEIFSTYSFDKPIVDSYAKLYFPYFYPDGAPEGTKMFMTYPEMSAAATELYKGVGNNMALYGIFASSVISYYGNEVMPTMVLVQDGYITDIAFWFDMSIMYGFVVIHLDDFGTTATPEGISFDNYETRQVPTEWSQIPTNVGETTMMDEKIAEVLGQVEVPFLGECLGDTFAVGMEYVLIASDRLGHVSLQLFYDVPLDPNYTVDSTLRALDTYLKGLGFTKNSSGEYNKGDLWILPRDEDLDLMIYVWVTGSSSQDE